MFERFHSDSKRSAGTFHCSLFGTFMYRQTPEIETADFSQSRAGLNLSQFQTDFLLRINSSTAILNYLNQC